MSSATSRQVRQQLGQLDAALRRACANFHGLPNSLALAWAALSYLMSPGKVLAVASRQLRLGVEQVDVARPALHEQRDHRLGPRRGWGRLGRQVEDRPFERRACAARRPGRRPGASSQARASEPRPMPWRARKCRRLAVDGDRAACSASDRVGRSIDVQEPVRAEEGLAERRQREAIGVVRASGSPWPFAAGVGVRAKSVPLLGQERRRPRRPARRPARCRRASRQAWRTCADGSAPALAATRSASVRRPARRTNSLFIRSSDCGATVEVVRRSQFGLSDRRRRTSREARAAGDRRTWT